MPRSYDKDPYLILGVPPTANASQIKEAYYRLARRYHPDVNKDPGAADRMKDINWANDILRDPQERAQYDFWRTASARTAYYSPHSDAPSRSSQSSPPPRNRYYAPPRSTYTNPPAARGPSSCAPSILVWVVMTILLNVLRTMGSLSQPRINYSATYFATQTAVMETMVASIETFHASQQMQTDNSTPTLLPLFQTTHEPSLSATPTVLRDELGHPDMRSRVVPGSWEWEQVHAYFPELTTPDGLSDEVTLMIYDQLQGYHIETRTLGDYWIYVDRYAHGFYPVHYPPVTPTP